MRPEFDFMDIREAFIAGDMTRHEAASKAATDPFFVREAELKFNCALTAFEACWQVVDQVWTKRLLERMQSDSETAAFMKG